MLCLVVGMMWMMMMKMFLRVRIDQEHVRFGAQSSRHKEAIRHSLSLGVTIPEFGKILYILQAMCTEYEVK